MKKTNLISLIVFVVALVWVFTLDNKTIRNIQSKVLGVFGIAHETVAAVSFNADLMNSEPIGPQAISERYDKEELAERYSALLRELFELRAWQGHIDHLREENIELRRSLNFVDLQAEQGKKLIAARVIERESGSWWRTIIIDKGSDDGVAENTPVMTPVAVDEIHGVRGALVGKVTNVSRGQSMVVLITDPQCHVAARVEKAYQQTASGPQRVQGILSGAPGAGTTVPHLILRNLPKESDAYGVKAGATVISSGIMTEAADGVFPPALLLGYIKEFEVKDIDAEARVAPAIDFNALSNVFVLLPDESIQLAPKAAPIGIPPAPPAAPPVPPAVPPAVPPVATPATDAPRAPARAEAVTPSAPSLPSAADETPVPAAEPVVPRARPVEPDDGID